MTCPFCAIIVRTHCERAQRQFFCRQSCGESPVRRLKNLRNIVSLANAVFSATAESDMSRATDCRGAGGMRVRTSRRERAWSR